MRRESTLTQLRLDQLIFIFDCNCFCYQFYTLLPRIFLIIRYPNQHTYTFINFIALIDVDDYANFQRLKCLKYLIFMRFEFATSYGTNHLVNFFIPNDPKPLGTLFLSECCSYNKTHIRMFNFLNILQYWQKLDGQTYAMIKPPRCIDFVYARELQKCIRE